MQFLRRWWRYILAAVALGLLVRYVGPRDLFATLAETRFSLLLLYLAAYALVPFLFGVQVHVALRLGGHRIPLATSVGASVSAWSVGTLTPARAGDLSLTYFLRGTVPEGDAVAVVVSDKLVSLGTLAALAVISTWVVPVPYGNVVALGAAIVLVAAVVALVIVHVRGADAPLRGLTGRLLGARAVGAWDRLRGFVAAPRFLAWNIVATTARWLYICGINLIIFRAVSEHPDFAHVTAATAVGRIISLVPVSVGGLGVKEPAQILIYAGAGVPAEAVLAVSVLGMACGLVIAAIAPHVLRGEAAA